MFKRAGFGGLKIESIANAAAEIARIVGFLQDGESRKAGGGRTETDLQFAALLNFAFQGGIGGPPFGDTGHFDGLRKQASYDDSGADGGHRGNGLQDAHQPVFRMPEIPDFQPHGCCHRSG